jgi:DNA helicase HerA-like ATPase
MRADTGITGALILRETLRDNLPDGAAWSRQPENNIDNGAIMDTSLARDARPATSSATEMLGRVVSVTGSQATIELGARAQGAEKTTVGKFVGLMTGATLIVGMITEIGEQPMAAPVGGQAFRKIARLDLLGEIRAATAGAARFERGVTEYPSIGDNAMLLGERELRLVYGGADADHAHIGDLQQNSSIGVHIDIDSLVSRHFAVLGATGVGKSSGVAIILQKILDTRPNLRIFLVDPHNEYGRCFGDKAQVLTPRNLRLPFWLFNFEETIDAFFGGRPGVEEEIEILSDVIPLAKAAYLQYRGGPAERTLAKKKDPRSTGFTADTPVPYRIEDLINLLDERMGKLDARTQRVTIHRLITRIQTFRNHPRYAFMFEGANIGGDIMAEILSHLFRLPPEGKPMTIMQLAGFPAEVVDSVVSVLCRMAFDFGLWSDGVAPLLFVCEEAHRYAPADKKIGFGPTRRALSRVAKEGRKYGVFLGLITQRPAEIDPTIISQCSTLFCMRLSNDHDQALIRSAVSDAAANLLSFIPSLGTREVFTFGPGVAMPTRMRFSEIAESFRPNSEAAGNTRSDAGTHISRDLISSVIERWRSASTSHRSGDDDTADYGSPLDGPALQPALQPAAPVAPPIPAPPPPPASPVRSSLLRKPLESNSPYPLSNSPPSYPPKFR